MRIKCNVCSKPVSTLVPEGTVLRAWVECPECARKLFDAMEEMLVEGKEKTNEILRTGRDI